MFHQMPGKSSLLTVRQRLTVKSLQATRLGRALTFSSSSSCPGCVGACSCHGGALLHFDNLQLSTVACSFDQQPRVVSLSKCKIKKNGEKVPADCGKLGDQAWDGDSETVATGGLSDQIAILKFATFCN